jgi:hypothetical protein
MTLETILHLAISPWGLAGGCLALLALPAYRLAHWHWRARRLLEIQLRLEEGWQNTGMALALWSLTRSPARLRKPGLSVVHSPSSTAPLGLSGGGVLSKGIGVQTPQTVQQREVSCDI